MNRFFGSLSNEKIESINTWFIDDWNIEKEKDTPDYNRFETKVWRKINNTFWSLPSEYTLLQTPIELTPETDQIVQPSQDLLLQTPIKLTPETLQCFSSLKKALESNGVQLIVSLTPNPYTISSRVINENFRDVPDLLLATYVRQLSEIGIETIYSSDAIIENCDRFPFAFFLSQ